MGSRYLNHVMEESFGAFAKRFVRCYWEEVARGAPEFASHSEPVNWTLDEQLQQIEYDTSYSRIKEGSKHENIFVLRMADTEGDDWRFTFRHANDQWLLAMAWSGSKRDEKRIDLLDDVYDPYFRPFFERIIKNASDSI